MNIFKKEKETINSTMDEVKELSANAKLLLAKVNNDYDGAKNAVRATLKIVIASSLFGPPGGIITYFIEKKKGHLNF